MSEVTTAMIMRRSATKDVGKAAALAALCLTAGCGTKTVGVATPEALLAFSPQPDDPSARITAVERSGGRTYVGFSNGEMFFRADGAAGWSAYDKGAPGCDQPVPGGPITAFAITEQTVFTAYAGTPGAPGIWRSPVDLPCWSHELIADDFLGLSVSPFSSVELLALGEGGRWATRQLGADDWNQETLPSLSFDGDARAMATGVSPTGARRAWLGDGSGHVYYSDDSAAASAPGPIAWRLVAPDPGFPRRPVVAISVASDRPQTVWITFFGLAPDSLWTSDDGGVSWRNPHGGELSSAGEPSEDAGTAARPGATFVRVNPVPGAGAALVTALVPSSAGRMTATSFWSADGSEQWCRL